MSAGPTFTEVMDRLDGVLADLEALRTRVDASPAPTIAEAARIRSAARSVAIAITNAETAALWLECASRAWTS